jgi:2-polyprenyl-3-methyl-5-hydroxy-6-metoxy-1,4-benzoquinol methylase
MMWRVNTQGADYAARLQRLSGARWKRLLNVQAPYRWRLRRYQLGVTLDVGCGIGRNLTTLASGSHGVDHNADSIEVARRQGFSASTSDEFLARTDRHEGRFDSLLFAHVLEHMTKTEAVDLVSSYLRFLKPGGRTLFICPQERGYASDSTHVEFMTGDDLREVACRAGLRPSPASSFPFPRFAGRMLTYNETHAAWLP